MNKVSAQEIHDCKFAKEQVTNFARAQRGSIPGIEMETLSGVIHVYKNTPNQPVGWHVPSEKFPVLGSGHMSFATALLR